MIEERENEYGVNDERNMNEIVNDAIIAIPQPDIDIVEKTVKDTMKVFEMFQIDERYAEEGVAANVRLWHRKKEALRAMFRKHPGWDEREQAFFTKIKYSRVADKNAAENALYRITSHLWNTKGWDAPEEQCDKIMFLDTIKRRFAAESTVSKNNIGEDWVIEKITKYFGAKIAASVKPGARHTRILRKLIDVCAQSCDCDKTLIEKEFAKYADAITPRTIEKTAVFSLNFCDFLLMSNGNSWASCHYINTHGLFHENGDSHYRGMYRRGTLSYAEDDCSFIFYTIPSKLEKENFLTPKIDRMCCQYKSGYLITGKLYPNNDNELRTLVRHFAQDTIASLVQIPSQWRVTYDTHKIVGEVETADDSGHYPDYAYDGQHPARSVLKPLIAQEDIPLPVMTIGAPGLCVCCGKSLDNFGSDGETLACRIHKLKTIKCERCGHVATPPEDFDPDYDDSFTSEEGKTFHWVEEEWLCEDCCFFCDYHQQWEAGAGTTVADGDVVCNRALREEYFLCSSCGEYHHLNEESALSGVCADCYEKYYHVCEHCGKIIENGTICSCQDPNYGKIEKKELYSLGDYVIIGADLSRSYGRYGRGPGMEATVGVIGKVINATEESVRVRVATWTSWLYSTEDIVGALKRAEPSVLYRKYEEVFGHEPKITE